MKLDVIKKFLVVVMAIGTVFLIVPERVSYMAPLERSQSIDSLSLVPLDDRPFPFYTTKQIAEIGGFQAHTPDKDLLGNYFTPGNGEAVGEWWMKDSAKTSASVIAIPMLAYGGLINSRYGEVSLEEAKENLQVIKNVKEQNPDKKVYAFDTLMRLTISPTASYPGNYAGEIREWSILKDKIENLGMDDQDLVQRFEELSASIPEELIEDYLKARKRNFSINNLMIDWVDQGIIDFLIIGQDDADPYGLHRPEHLALQERIQALGLNEKIKIIPGADVVGSLLVTKLMLEEFGVEPKLYVEYSRVHGDEWIAPYQNILYSEVIQNYVSILGGTVVSDHEKADIVLMANTAGTEQIDSFAERIYEFVGKGYHVAVGDDATPGRSDSVLIDLLDERIKFSNLMGYSGWNVGVSITQSFARWGLMEFIKHGKLNVLKRSAEAHLELLLEALAHEEGYRNHVRDQTRDRAKSLGEDPQQIVDHYEEVNQFAVTRTKPLADEWYKHHFSGQNIFLGGNGNIVGTVADLNDWDMYLPWNRYTELAAFPDLELSFTPLHKHHLVQNTPLPFKSVAPVGSKSHQIKVVVSNQHEQPVIGDVSLDLPDGWVASPVAHNFSLSPNESREVIFIVNVPSDVIPDKEYQLWSNVSYRFVKGKGKAKGLIERHVNQPFYITSQYINYALQSQGGMATASSHFNAYTADNANDGNKTHIRSRWISEKADIHWLQVAFPQVTTINNVRMIGYEGFPLIDYKIQVRQNGNWNDVVTVSGNEEVVREHTFETVKADAVRLWITNTSDGQARVYELEAYNK